MQCHVVWCVDIKSLQEPEYAGRVFLQMCMIFAKLQGVTSTEL